MDSKNAEKNYEVVTSFERHDAFRTTARSIPTPTSKLKRKKYDALLRPLHAELAALQSWVTSSGAKICVIFEGRDAAGKGSTIATITEHVDPRVFRVVTLPAATERERSQLHIQRYMPHLPAGGEVVIFDTSWYSRAGVERVTGQCSKDEVRRFLNMVPSAERAMVDSGIFLVKYWLEIGPAEQTRRIEARINDPRKAWQLSETDLESYAKWDEYTKARDKMFASSDTPWAPWYVADFDDRRRARLNLLTHLLERIPYKPVPRLATALPKREVSASAPSLYAPPRTVPERY